MLRFIKFLKPFAWMIVLSILLLYGQAMATLALPNYMSNIVNIGIQQSGIERAEPMVIGEDAMESILRFTSKNDREKIVDAFALYQATPSEPVHIERLSFEVTQSVYVLDSSSTPADLHTIMSVAIAAHIRFDRLVRQSEDSFSIGSYTFYVEDADRALAALSPEQREDVAEKLVHEWRMQGENVLVQAAIQWIIREYEAIGMDLSAIRQRYILRNGMWMLAIAFFAAVCIIGVGYFAARASAGVAKDMRHAVFSHVQSFSKAEIDRFSTASLITRSTNDVTQVQQVLFMVVRILFFAPIMGVGAIIMALDKSASMSWIIAIAVSALLVLVMIVFVLAMPRFKKIQMLTDRLNLVTRENLTGLPVVKAFNNRRIEEERFDQANHALTDTTLFVNRVMVFMFPTMMLIMNGITLLIIWVGANQIAHADMQVGDMMAFMQYVMQVIFAFLQISFLFIMVPRGAVSAQRINEVLHTKSDIIDPIDPIDEKKEQKGVVTFNRVCFQYEGAQEYALKDISFEAKPGQTVAIIGSTGAGKTTLLNLILRFYDVSSGSVSVNGVDVRKMTQKKLRERIAYVPQRSVLFTGSIKSNLQYGSQETSDEKLKKAAEIAQAKAFIDEKEEDFDFQVAQAGANVSGGQKQRLAIARAIMKDADVYLFDDSFSALDFQTDYALRKALKENLKDATILLVAQRVATIVHADQIVVLDSGKIVGVGTHKELMKDCNTYREIALSQLTEEELA